MSDPGKLLVLIINENDYKCFFAKSKKSFTMKLYMFMELLVLLVREIEKGKKCRFL